MTPGRGTPEAGPPAAAELVLATRGSTLALAQARLVQAALGAAGADAGCRIMPVTTRGDRTGGASDLAALARSSPGLFTADVGAAVRDGSADAAVHSLKDLPLEQPPGLCLAAILPRAAAQDVLVIAPRWFEPAAPLGLRPGATVGTSSPRRAALLRHFAPEALADYERSFGNPETVRATCDDYRAGATIDCDLDAADRAAGHRIACPMLALWGDRRGDRREGMMEVWGRWATDLRGAAIPCGHFLPEEAPDETAAALLEFFSEG